MKTKSNTKYNASDINKQEARIQKFFRGGVCTTLSKKKPITHAGILVIWLFFVDWFCLTYNCVSAQIWKITNFFHFQ